MKAKKRKAYRVVVDPAEPDPRYPGGTVAVDVETTGLSAWHGRRPFAISFFWGTGDPRNFFAQWPVDPKTRRVDYAADWRSVEKVKRILADPLILKVFHNWKFDVRHCELAWEVLAASVADTLHAAKCCDTSEPSYALKPLSAKYLGIPDDDESDLHKATAAVRKTIFSARLKTRKTPAKFPERANWREADDLAADYWMVNAADPTSTLVKRYNVRDTERTLGLWNMYVDVMEDLDVRRVYDDDMATLWTTYRMEARGVRIDPDVCDSEAAYWEEQTKEAEAFLADEAKHYPGKGTFEITKPAALGWLLYDRWKLDCYGWTKTGQRSTALEALAPHMDHPGVRSIVLARTGQKAVTGVYEAYKRHAVKDDDGLAIIHCNYTVGETTTGRLSGRDPNLQNVADPDKTPFDGRKPFCPRPGYRWYHADYEQLEVRVFASLSGEPTLLEELRSNADIHGDTANRIWSGVDNPRAIKAAMAALASLTPEEREAALGSFWDAEAVSREYWEDAAAYWLGQFDGNIVKAEASIGKKRSRGRAKIATFTKLFGGGVPSIKKTIGCDDEEARAFLNALSAKYRNMNPYIRQVGNEARRNGYVRTVDGRRITAVPDKEYKAANHVTQGSAADFVKSRMRASEKFLWKSGCDAHLILQIHDELVIEVADRDATRDFLRDFRAICEDHEGRFVVPTPVEIVRTRVNWSQKEKIAWLR